MVVVLLIRENLSVIKLIWAPQLKRRKSLSWQCIAWNCNGRQNEKTCMSLSKFEVRPSCEEPLWLCYGKINDSRTELMIFAFNVACAFLLQRVRRIGACGPSGRIARASMASLCRPRANGMETEMTKVRWKNHPVFSLQFFFPSIAFLSILELP